MKKILLLGGTGAMGISLTQILDKSPYHVYVTSRSKRESYANIEYIQGNAHDEVFLKQLFRQHYDCIVDFMVYTTDEFQKRVDMLLEATDQYIFLSSSRVYAQSHAPIKETSPRLLDVCKDEEYLKTDEYALAKARQENILINGNKRNYTIVRPYITYNDNRLQLGVMEKEYWLERAMSNHTIVFSKDIGECYTTLTYGYDVAFLISKLIDNDKAIGETFHITNNESIKWKDVLDIYANILAQHGIDVKIQWIEDSHLIDRGLGNHYQIYYDRLYNRIFDNEKILHISNCKDYVFLSTKIGLERCLNNFINKQIRFLPKSYKLEGIFDKSCHESYSIKEIKGWKNKIRYILYRYIY